jgi:hypothetical protein
VPVAVIGSEEEARRLAQPRRLQRLLKTPTAPITATLFVPLPVRYRIHVGEPFHPSRPPTPARVAELVQHVRELLSRLIADGLAARPHVFR